MDHLRSIRQAEIEFVAALIPSGSRVLEIGAGAGWQALALAKRGLHVEAIEIAPVSRAGPAYDQHRVCPVTIYDGATIPFQDAHFDVIYSSNVLEHIPHLSTFHAEMMRVLRPDGLAIHIVPTGTWRFWSNLSHYVHVGRRALELVRQQLRKPHTTSPEATPPAHALSKSAQLPDRLLDVRRILGAALPPRHGEAGNALSEIWRFRRKHWDRLFLDAGWQIARYRTNRLYYTGSSVLGSSLSQSVRQSLSRLLGSSCHVYALRRVPARGQTAA